MHDITVYWRKWRVGKSKMSSIVEFKRKTYRFMVQVCISEISPFIINSVY